MGFTIKDVRDGLAKGHFTSEEIFKTYSDKIKKDNKKLNAYLSIFDQQSQTNEQYYITNFSKQRAPLFGIPCAIKDNMLIEGTIATADPSTGRELTILLYYHKTGLKSMVIGLLIYVIF